MKMRKMTTWMNLHPSRISNQFTVKITEKKFNNETIMSNTTKHRINTGLFHNQWTKMTRSKRKTELIIPAGQLEGPYLSH